MARIFDFGTGYQTDAGVLTARMVYLTTPARDIPRWGIDMHERAQQFHAALKHVNKLLYETYGKTIKTGHWGGAAWVTLFLGERAVACYSILAPRNCPVYSETASGYEIRNEAVLRELRGKRVSSQALFPSIADAITLIESTRLADGFPPRGRTVSVGVDAGKASTAPTIAFLERQGFAVVPSYWRGTFLGDSNEMTGDLLRTFCFAETREALEGPTVYNLALVEPSAAETQLYKRV
jgi:hypothetical protein